MKSEQPENPLHRDRQAELLDYMLRHRDTTNIESLLWYTLADNGWKHSDMANGETACPAYEVWHG